MATAAALRIASYYKLAGKQHSKSYSSSFEAYTIYYDASSASSPRLYMPQIEPRSPQTPNSRSPHHRPTANSLRKHHSRSLGSKTPGPPRSSPRLQPL